MLWKNSYHVIGDHDPKGFGFNSQNNISLDEASNKQGEMKTHAIQYHEIKTCDSKLHLMIWSYIQELGIDFDTCEALMIIIDDHLVGRTLQK